MSHFCYLTDFDGFLTEFLRLTVTMTVIDNRQRQPSKASKVVLVLHYFISNLVFQI